MDKNRLEAFTDGVMAIIITIMILEIDVPKEVGNHEIMNLISSLLVYLLSYVYVGIYWFNHHHLLHTAKKVNGKVLQVNLMLLFFLSLIPLATKWVNEDMITASVVFYGLCLMMSAISYYMLVKVLIKGNNTRIVQIYEKEGFKKEYISLLIYALGLVFAFFSYFLSILMYVIVGIIWIIPDKKIERSFLEECED